MADTGANVCVTGDASILVELVDIDPIPLGAAVKSTDTHASLCTKQGYPPHPSPGWYLPLSTIPVQSQRVRHHTVSCTCHVVL